MRLNLPPLPQYLYYNCLEPLKILESGIIKVSKIFKGVSFSTNYQLKAHGPFKIVFKQSPWFQDLKVVVYPTPVYTKNNRLRGELRYYKDQFGNKFTREEYELI